MKHLADTNAFIAVAVEQHAHHEAAAHWFNGLGDQDTVAFCRASQTSFLRLLTRKIAESYCPLTNRQAWQVYDQLCEDDAVTFAEEPPGLEAVWRELASPAKASPKLWMDAYLAAFAIAGHYRLVTFDHDFKTFEAQGLDLWLLNP